MFWCLIKHRIFTFIFHLLLGQNLNLLFQKELEKLACDSCGTCAQIFSKVTPMGGDFKRYPYDKTTDCQTNTVPSSINTPQVSYTERGNLRISTQISDVFFKMVMR
jgi:hypothetical protein